MSKSLNDFIKDQSALFGLLQAVEGIVWQADAITFDFSYVSENVKDILGYTSEEWLDTPQFWQDHIYKEDRELAIKLCSTATQKSENHTFDYRMVDAEGNLVWIRDIVSVIVKDGKPSQLLGIMVDVTDTKTLYELDHLEKEVLELAYHNDSDIAKVLNTYLLGIEQLFPRMKCSILKVKGSNLYNWSAPSLPKAYTNAIEGIAIGPLVGSCGTAAHLKEMVIVTDIANDQRWADYKGIALSNHLKACWSIPVIDTNEKVLAVLGIYYNTIKEPSKKEMGIIKRAAAILKVILENRAYAAATQEINMLLLQSQSLANFGSWQWDIESNKVTWSNVLYSIYGLNKETFKATFEGYQSLLHPDDKEYVTNIIKNALATGEEVVFEERIVRPDGEIRFLNSWGRVIKDKAGKSIKMVGACLDITKAKNTQERMKEIAWQQSHIVRAPLASLMGLVELLKEETFENKELQKLLEHIINTSKKLDDVIRTISSQTKQE